MSQPQGILAHDPELSKSLLGAFLDLLRWSSLVVAFLVAWQPWAQKSAPHDILMASSTAALFAATFVYGRLVKAGHILLVSWLLLGGGIATLLSQLLHRGPTAPETFILLSITPLAALLLGLRTGVAVGVAQMGAIVFFWILHPGDFLPPAPPETFALMLSVVSLTVVCYLEIPARGLFSAIRLSLKEQEELDEAIQILEEETKRLTAEIGHRTRGLTEANRSQARLAASLSHDLRAPLRSITGFAETLSEQDRTEGVQHQLQGILADVASLQSGLERSMASLRRENGV